MGFFTGAIIYSLGVKRGKKRGKAPIPVAGKPKDSDCDNFWAFCKEYGSCDGMVCTYEERG